MFRPCGVHVVDFEGHWYCMDGVEEEGSGCVCTQRVKERDRASTRAVGAAVMWVLC